MQKCKKCGASWSSNEKLVKCPYCGNNLDEFKYIDNITDAFDVILKRHGEGVFMNGPLLLGLLGDYAPGLTHERKLVKIAIESGAYERIYKCPASQKEMVANKCIVLLNNSYYIDAYWAKSVISWYLEALGHKNLNLIDIKTKKKAVNSEISSAEESGKRSVTQDSSGNAPRLGNSVNNGVPQNGKVMLFGIISVCTVGLIILLSMLFNRLEILRPLSDSSSSNSEIISAPMPDSVSDSQGADNNLETKSLSSGNTKAKETKYPGYIDLERNKEISVDLSGNGSKDTFYFAADISDFGAKSITLTINGKETIFDLSDSPLSVTYLGVCAADINLNDDYKNIMIFKSQSTEVYIYDSEGNLTLIAELHGAVKPDELDGSGKLVYYHTGILNDREGNELVSEYIGNVDGKTYIPVSNRVGVLLGATKSQFVEGFSYLLYKDMPTYTDNLLSFPTGMTIPSGTTIDIEEYCDRGGRPLTWTYRVKWNGQDLWIASPYDF